MSTTNPAANINIDDASLAELAARVGRHLLASQRTLVTAESCTGGWIGKALTDIAGSSAWFLGGAIAYGNAQKQRMLDVDAATLRTQGAVSEAAVRAMAEGALARVGGDIAVAVSGIAGPDGGSADKPVGTVWFAWAFRSEPSLPSGEKEVSAITARQLFTGDREAVRRQTVAHALHRVLLL